MLDARDAEYRVRTAIPGVNKQAKHTYVNETGGTSWGCSGIFKQIPLFTCRTYVHTQTPLRRSIYICRSATTTQWQK